MATISKQTEQFLDDLDNSLEGVKQAMRGAVNSMIADLLQGQATAAVESPAEMAEPKKRGRGRPRKNPLPEPDPEAKDDSQAAVAVKKGRGRPAGVPDAGRVRKKKDVEAPPNPELPTDVEAPAVVTEGQFDFHGQVRDWASETSKGVQIVKMALAERKVNSVLEIPEKDGKDFLSRCQALSEELGAA